MVRTRWSVRGRRHQLTVAAAALLITAVSISQGGVSSQQGSAIASSDAAGQTLGLTSGYVRGEVIVRLKAGRAGGIQALSQDAVLQKYRAGLLRLQEKYGVQERGRVFTRLSGRLQYYVLTTQRNVLAVCAELNADPEVEYAQPNYIYRPCRTPNDPDFADQYAHRLIQMEDAWDICTGSRDVAVAVIGTGVDVNHPDLKDNIWVNKAEVPGNKLDDDGNGFIDDVHGWNFGDSNNQVSPGEDVYGDYLNHETQVAGVIAAVGNNGKGVSGVNWQCSIMVLRLGDEYHSDEVAAALDYAAANGARVVNMSFGGDIFGPEGDKVVNTAIDNAYQKGVLLVASAGNSDSSRLHYPAAYFNVMAVASTNGEDLKTGHSTFGPWVDIAAPGTDIVTTDLGDGYISTAGTSFSGPYVAAVAALLFAHRPGLTHVEARAILENTTDPVDYGDLDPNLGYLGTGRVNAYQALLAADEKLPLGEIASPKPYQTFASDVNAIELCIFVHGDSYQLDCHLYGQSDWTTVSDGNSPADPNGLVHVSWANPGVGTYEFRLRVNAGGRTHIDRKVFGIDMAPAQAHWPKPEKPVGEDEQPEEVFIGSPICMDVDGNGTNEIIQCSVDLSSLWGTGRVHIWSADGNSLPHWPMDFTSDDPWALTDFWPSSVAVGDIDGDGDYEVVMASEYDNEMYACHVQSGEIVDGNWPAQFGWAGSVSAGPVLADLDGDGDSEILVALDAESSDSDGLYAFQGDGNPMWQRRYTSAGPISVADFDGDGDVEIALCGYGPGLSRYYTFILDHQGQQVARWKGGSPKGTAVADIDGDGKQELIFCTEEEVTVGRVNGSTVWKKKVSDPLGEPGGLSVGDMDGDGHSEVYVTTYIAEADGFAFTRVYGFDYKGRELSDAGFPKIVMGSPAKSVPLIAEIDGDGQKELIVAPWDEPIIAWEPDGSVTPGFPMLGLPGLGEVSPAVADLDRDGDVELMVISDYQFHVLDLPAPYSPELIDWGMAGHDPQNSRWVWPAPKLDPLSAPAEIRPGQRIQVQLTASNPANAKLRWCVGNLPEGAYYDAQSRTMFWKPAAEQAFKTYAFSFLVTDGVRQDSRSMSITVVPDAIYYATMNADPNWTLDEGWAWGTPTGKGSWNGDPNTGHTGKNVIGYTLDGDYANDLIATRYATTGPINCRGYKNIHLSFWRWLGVESPYDQASIQVSNDGVTWVDLWVSGRSHISDNAWQFVEYAVPPAVGDGQATLYFRWGLGPTDDSVVYPGWNIDDVQVTGDRAQ
jgi:subtilisin family serine protease